MANTAVLKMDDIRANTGQIPGVKANPRCIKNEKYEKLKKSLQDNPEMLDLRELLVYEHEGKYICIGGNMRYRACKELGHKEVPCKIIPPTATPDQLNAYIIKDNAGFGEWDWDMLANEWEREQLDDWGLDVWQEEKEEAEQAEQADARDDTEEKRQRDPDSEIIVAAVSLFGKTEDMILTQSLTEEETEKLISLAKKEGAGNLISRIIKAL